MKRARSVSIEEYIDQDWCFDVGSDDDALEIASLIKKWSLPGNWLDLGCGPMLTVWPMFSSNNVKIWGLDRNPAALTFHMNLIQKQPLEWPQGLKKALDFYYRYFVTVNNKLSLTPINEIEQIIIADLLEEQAQWKTFFNTIIQIGCFGCLNSINDLKFALNLVAQYLTVGGRFISATWLPRSNYLESEVWGGVNLTNLSSKSFKKYIEEAGLSICEVREASLKDDQYYLRYVFIAEKSSNGYSKYQNNIS